MMSWETDVLTLKEPYHSPWEWRTGYIPLHCVPILVKALDAQGRIPLMDHQMAENYIVRESSWREWIQPL